MITLFAAFLCLRLLFLWVTSRCADNCLVKKIKDKPISQAAVARFFLESCIELGIVTLMALHGLSWKDFATVQDGTSACLAACSLLCLCLAPLYMLVISCRLYVKADQLTPQQKALTEELFADYRATDPSATLYGVLFFLRRYLMVSVLVLFA